MLWRDADLAGSEMEKEYGFQELEHTSRSDRKMWVDQDGSESEKPGN